MWVYFRLYYVPLGWSDGGRMGEGVYEGSWDVWGEGAEWSGEREGGVWRGRGAGRTAWGVKWDRGETVL